MLVRKSLLSTGLSLAILVGLSLNAAAAIVDIAVNGGFETGAFNDGSPDASWQQFPNGGIQTITTDNPSSGTYAAYLNVPVRSQTDPPVDNLIKNANLGAGTLTAGGPITVNWDLRGSLEGAGGVVFVELFSELTGGGTSKSEIYTGGPLFPTADWQSFTWDTTLGPDVSGGVTVQLKASCGPVEGCGVDAYFDNVSIMTDVVGIDGDFDGDSDVDGFDFLTWQRDPNVGVLADWQANYGTPAAPLVALSVPEPSSLAMLILMSFAAAQRRA